MIENGEPPTAESKRSAPMMARENGPDLVTNNFKMYLGLSNIGGRATSEPLRNEGQSEAEFAEQSIALALNQNEAATDSLEATPALG